MQDPEHHDGARDTRWRDDRMTGRRSHGRLSALNGVVHQGRACPRWVTDLAAEPAPPDHKRGVMKRPLRALRRAGSRCTPQTPAGDAASTAPAPSATTPSPIGSGPPPSTPSASISYSPPIPPTPGSSGTPTIIGRRRRGPIPLYPGISRYIPAYLGSFFLFAGTKAAAREVWPLRRTSRTETREKTTGDDLLRRLHPVLHSESRRGVQGGDSN